MAPYAEAGPAYAVHPGRNSTDRAGSSKAGWRRRICASARKRGSQPTRRKATDCVFVVLNGMASRSIRRPKTKHALYCICTCTLHHIVHSLDVVKEFFPLREHAPCATSSERTCSRSLATAPLRAAPNTARMPRDVVRVGPGLCPDRPGLLSGCRWNPVRHTPERCPTSAGILSGSSRNWCPNAAGIRSHFSSSTTNAWQHPSKTCPHCRPHLSIIRI